MSENETEHDEESICACTRTAGELPEHRPDTDGFEEAMVVHDRAGSMVVEISDLLDHPESWGAFLGDIAYVMSKRLAVEHDMSQEEAMALIQKGFNSDSTWLPERAAGSKAECRAKEVGHS